jgi:hypothetical protein
MPSTTQTTPITAQNVLPVIDDPWITFVPWPIQTTPTRMKRSPSTRLTAITTSPTRGREGRFADYGRRTWEAARMKKLLELLICFIHPVAVVLGWINRAGRTDLSGGTKIVWGVFCSCRSCRSSTC